MDAGTLLRGFSASLCEMLRRFVQAGTLFRGIVVLVVFFILVSGGTFRVVRCVRVEEELESGFLGEKTAFYTHRSRDQMLKSRDGHVIKC